MEVYFCSNEVQWEVLGEIEDSRRGDKCSKDDWDHGLLISCPFSLVSYNPLLDLLNVIDIWRKLGSYIKKKMMNTLGLRDHEIMSRNVNWKCLFVSLKLFSLLIF